MMYCYICIVFNVRWKEKYNIYYVLFIFEYLINIIDIYVNILLIYFNMLEIR